MKSTRHPQRWLIILLVGLVVIAAAKVTISHPYFYLVVWTDRA